MKILNFFLIATMTLLSVSCAENKINSSAANESSTQASKLIGSWKIIEYSDFDTLTNKWSDRYGQEPRGYFIYTKSGIVVISISTGNQMNVTEDSAKNMNVNYHQMYKNNAFSYFGTYAVDWEKSTVTHYVKGGSLLWYIDTDQPRTFILRNDTLIIGDNKTTKRILVRED